MAVLHLHFSKLIFFAFSNNLSAENSKLSADSRIQRIQLLECVVAGFPLRMIDWQPLHSLTRWLKGARKFKDWQSIRISRNWQSVIWSCKFQPMTVSKKLFHPKQKKVKQFCTDSVRVLSWDFAENYFSFLIPLLLSIWGMLARNLTGICPNCRKNLAKCEALPALGPHHYIWS